jgi:TatD DNase family protein
MPPPFFDAHNHLQDEWLAPHLARIAARLPSLGVRRAVVNGTHEADWPHVVELSRQYLWALPSFGLHPWHVGNRSPVWREKLVALLDAHPAAGVGEIGLDRWMLDRARPDDPRLAGLRRAPLLEQREVFTTQLAIAAERNLPATIHCLEAWGALEEILNTTVLPARGFLLHAYGGSADLLPRFIERGAYFSFNGYFLGERKERQRAVFRTVPIDRLLVETDAPAMPLPQTWRTHKLPPAPTGEPVNHPGNLEAVYAGLASLRGLSLPELAARVQENFERLFGHPTPRVAVS